MSDNKPNFPEDRILDRLTMFADDPSAEGERAQLQWKVRNNNAELTVWTRGASEKGKPPVRASLNYVNAVFVVDALKQVADADGKTHIDIPVRTSRRSEKDGKPFFENVLQSTIRVAQDSDGIIQIVIIDADDSRPRVLFKFGLDRWTGIMKVNGEAVSESYVSKMVARRYGEIFKLAVDAVAKPMSKSERDLMFPPRDDQKRGNGGGQQRPYQQRQSSGGDDYML